MDATGSCKSSDSDSDYSPENVKCRARKRLKSTGIKKPKRKAGLEVRPNKCASSTTSRPVELPLELLVMIFHYIVQQLGPFVTLKKYGLVSKKWRLALLENSLWQSVSLDGKKSWLNINRALKWLCKFKYHAVNKLTMSQWRPTANNTGFDHLLQLSHQIKYVEFNACVFKYDEVFKCLDQVEELTVVQCNVKSFNTLVQTCKETLRYLALNEVGCSLCRSLSSCGTPLVKLTTLQLDNFYRFRGDSLNVLQKMCPNLIHLRLCFVTKVVSKDFQPEVGLNGFINLRYLELTFEIFSNGGCEGHYLCTLLAASPNLRSLSLIHFTQSYELSNDKLVSLMSSSLTELALFYCNLDFTELFSKLLLCCDTLKHLTIVNPRGYRVTDDIITTIITSPCINTLKYLDLSGTDVTINGIRMLLNFVYNLKYLDLSRCRYLPRGTKHLYNTTTDLRKLSEKVL